MTGEKNLFPCPGFLSLSNFAFSFWYTGLIVLDFHTKFFANFYYILVAIPKIRLDIIAGLII